MRAALVAGILLAASLAGCVVNKPIGTPDNLPPTVEGKGPAWTLKDTEGVTHDRDTPAGNATLLFFMASWCGSCRSKTPMLARLHTDFAPQGVRFYSVTFDPTDGDDSLRAWKAKYGNHWPHGVDPGFHIQRTFGVTQQSSLVVLNATGHVVQQWGYPGADESSLRSALNRAVA